METLFEAGVLIASAVFVTVFVVGWGWYLFEEVRRRARAAYQGAEKASRRQTLVHVEPAAPETRAHLRIPSGAEVFTPQPLRPDRVYQISLVGTYEYWAGYGDGVRSADALYDTDDYGNFTIRYKGLHLDGRPLSAWPHVTVAEERGRHTYRFNIDGAGRTLSVVVRPPGGGLSASYGEQLGSALSVTVELLPTGTPSPKLVVEVRRPELVLPESAMAVTKTPEEQSRSRQQAAWRDRVQILRRETEARRNWEDNTFRTAYARAHGQELLGDRDRIVAKRAELERQETPEFLEYLRGNDGGLLFRLTGEFEALLIAERQELEKPSALTPLKKKLTPEEYRTRLIQRLRVAAEDTQALTAAYLEQRAKFDDLLRKAGLSDQEVRDELDKFEAQALPFLERHDKKVTNASDIEVLK